MRMGALCFAILTWVWVSSCFYYGVAAWEGEAAEVVSGVSFRSLISEELVEFS